ncbi:hypothetical protein GIB67_027485 [Kingdonia uniflora]|uniref:Uncharacterized protein n=1 Tax=Kingdonia uniflora TaxID=39325 RepID=A0A7J7MFW9_9MAGN|nr:hypothetical protein GIB67_027485 [Kingdonia uniflora]
MRKTEQGVITWRKIPTLERSFDEEIKGRDQWRRRRKGSVGFSYGGRFASVSMVKEKREISITTTTNEFFPSFEQLLKHPLALLALVPKDAALFVAGAVAGAAAKTFTAPLDRVKLLMQTHGLRAGQESAKKGIGFVESITLIGREEGLKGFWKGNLPQVIRIIPYSAVQLFAYEAYKKLFKDITGDKELSIVGRLAAGAFAGMTSTLLPRVSDQGRYIIPALHKVDKHNIVALRVGTKNKCSNSFPRLK